jgi:hypothetical protein
MSSKCYSFLFRLGKFRFFQSYGIFQRFEKERGWCQVNVIEFTPDPDVMIGFECGVDGCEVMLCTCDRYRITIIHISIFNFLAFNSIEV